MQAEIQKLRQLQQQPHLLLARHRHQQQLQQAQQQQQPQQQPPQAAAQPDAASLLDALGQQPPQQQLDAAPLAPASSVSTVDELVRPEAPDAASAPVLENYEWREDDEGGVFLEGTVYGMKGRPNGERRTTSNVLPEYRFHPDTDDAAAEPLSVETESGSKYRFGTPAGDATPRQTRKRPRDENLSEKSLGGSGVRVKVERFAEPSRLGSGGFGDGPLALTRQASEFKTEGEAEAEAEADEVPATPTASEKTLPDAVKPLSDKLRGMPPEMRTRKGTEAEPPAEDDRVEVLWVTKEGTGWYRGTVDKVNVHLLKGSLERPESQVWQHEFHVIYDDNDSKMHTLTGKEASEFWHLGPLMSE